MGSKRSRYDQVIDDVPFLVDEGQEWKLACCDCCLVHDVQIDDVGADGKLKVTVRQDARSTSSLRRHRQGDLQNSDGKKKRWMLVKTKK